MSNRRRSTSSFDISDFLSNNMEEDNFPYLLDIELKEYCAKAVKPTHLKFRKYSERIRLIDFSALKLSALSDKSTLAIVSEVVSYFLEKRVNVERIVAPDILDHCSKRQIRRLLPGGRIIEWQPSSAESSFDIDDGSHHGGPLLTSSLHFLQNQAYNYWELSKYSSRYTGQGKKICIIDSGIDPSHPAFYNNPRVLEDCKISHIAGFFCKDCTEQGCIKGCTGKDNIGHGTMCAGVACGSSFSIPDPSSNGQPFTVPSGVAPGAKLIICKVDSSSKSFMNALKFLNKVAAQNELDVVSCSLGFESYHYGIEQEVSKLISAGVIVVCSPSNHGHSYRQPIQYPAQLGHVLCVGSHGLHGKTSEFSPVNQEIDILAPGENIIGASPIGGYQVQTGTSFAVPAVAGLVCLILECIDKTGKLKADIKKKFGVPAINHWIMKMLLRAMATNPGVHFNDRGYGSLNPNRLFTNPESFIKSALELY